MVEMRLRAIVAGLDSRREELAQAMTTAVIDEVPEFRAVRDPVFRDEVLGHSREHVAAFIRSVASGQAPAGAQLDFVRARGAQRAR